MSKKAANVELEAHFNAASVRSAQNRKLLQGWLSGFTDQYSGQAKDETQIEQEEKGVFTLEPEIAGLGVPAQHLTDEEFARLDPSARIEDSSTAFLRQQLIGKKAKALKATPLRSAINLPGLEPGFQPLRIKTGASASDVNSNSTGAQQTSNLPDANVSDDEEEIGRSGLGSTRSSTKRKRKQSTAIPEAEAESDDISKTEIVVPAGIETSKNQSDHEYETRVSPQAVAGTFKAKPCSKKMSSRSKPKARSYLDEILAEKEAKKARKKSKNKAG